MKNKFFSSEKMRNSGSNCIYIMLTRSSERIYNPMRYAGKYQFERVGFGIIFNKFS